MDEAEGGPARLAQDDLLRDRIIEHLKRTGTDSISGVARMLSQGGSAPVHRLTVAGYLQALAESGILTELDRPPSKLYQLQNPEAHWSLHQRVWKMVLELHRTEEERVRLAIAVLQTLLGRPVFLAELQHAGVPRVPDAVEKVVVADDVRKQYRRLFERKSSPHIEIPQRDPLYALPPGDSTLGHSAVQDLIRRGLVKATGAEHLAVERAIGSPHQRALDIGGAA